MSDRYSTITREVPVDRPRNTVYASTSGASGELNSQHRVSLHPAGFRVRERGAIDATVAHAYRCPIHDAVDVRVSRADVPDKVACPAVDHREELKPGFWRCTPLPASEWGDSPDLDDPNRRKTHSRCGLTSTWIGSSCGIGHAAGEVTS